MTATAVERLTWEEYAAIPALSNSAMKDLAVSPLRYWYRHINPDRVPDKPTPEMQFGSALHCAILEPGEFDKRYACELIPPDGCLETMDDLRRWLKDKGKTPKGTRKDDLIDQCYMVSGDPPPILETLNARHAAENAGRVLFPECDWVRIAGAASSLLDEPRIQQLLSAGEPELSIQWIDPQFGVPMKARLDWSAPDWVLDLKTYSQKRGSSIDKSIASAIWNEGYHRQAFVYSSGRGWPTWRGDFVFAFVESSAPHDIRVRSMRSKSGTEVSLLWERARVEVRSLIQTYSECMAHFGPDRPWRYAREIEPLCDEEFPGVAY